MRRAWQLRQMNLDPSRTNYKSFKPGTMKWIKRWSRCSCPAKHQGTIVVLILKSLLNTSAKSHNSEPRTPNSWKLNTSKLSPLLSQESMTTQGRHQDKTTITVWTTSSLTSKTSIWRIWVRPAVHTWLDQWPNVSIYPLLIKNRIDPPVLN